MFSGIIHHSGTVVSLQPKGEGFLLSVESPGVAGAVSLGASVAHSGVCLTVYAIEGDVLSYEVMPETIRKTTLGQKKPGDRVNLETSLKMGDELGGHFVFGHVDAVATVTEVAREGDTNLVTFRPPRELMRYLGPQGSVAIDGVSLTVARVGEDTFTVSLIEYTQQYTTLGTLASGDEVNIECDMFAKYIAAQLDRATLSKQN